MIRDEQGIALPTALMAMIIMLMIGGLFVAYAAPQQQVTARAQSFETGLHVAETAVELTLAALSDPNQPREPVEAAGAPSDDAAAAAWAIDQARAQRNEGCTRFDRTAGGDGIGIVSTGDGAVYGVAFLPDCQTARTTRVVRVAYDTRPIVQRVGNFALLTNGPIRFHETGNAMIGAAGIHTNSHVTGGSPHTVNGPFTASGTCSAASATKGCVDGSERVNIPNFIARDFWVERNDPLVSQLGVPFFELCPGGQVRQSDANAERPCHPDTSQDATIQTGWEYSNSWTIGPSSPHHEYASDRGPAKTWRWTRNQPPLPGVYYGYQVNVVIEAQQGNTAVNGLTVLAEAGPEVKSGLNGGDGGSVIIRGNPRFIPAWTGVGIVADVDVVFEQNPQAVGGMAMIFAREQLHLYFNGNFSRFSFITCDHSVRRYEPAAAHCTGASDTPTTPRSPINGNLIRGNATLDTPADGYALVPNLGVTGVSEWQILR